MFAHLSLSFLFSPSFIRLFLKPSFSLRFSHIILFPLLFPFQCPLSLCDLSSHFFFQLSVRFIFTFFLSFSFPFLYSFHTPVHLLFFFSFLHSLLLSSSRFIYLFLHTFSSHFIHILSPPLHHLSLSPLFLLTLFTSFSIHFIHHYRFTLFLPFHSSFLLSPLSPPFHQAKGVTLSVSSRRLFKILRFSFPFPMDKAGWNKYTQTQRTNIFFFP